MRSMKLTLTPLFTGISRHRNVMTTERGMVKILDFGLAKFIAGSSFARPGNDYFSGPHRFSMETMPGVILGTPTYISPEQARGQEVDGRTDIFSLGVLLYRMVTGRALFEGSSVGDIMVSMLEREPQPPGYYITDAPRAADGDGRRRHK
jgi:serine/threonine protein kinase